jgi:hypothetical protein
MQTTPETALQTFTRPVDEAHLPALAQRVRRGQRIFIGIATTGMASWSLSYMLSVQDELPPWIAALYLAPQALAISVALSNRAEPYLTHTLLALLLLFELTWTAFNAYIGPTEVLTHAIAFSLPCFIALFVPLAPRYLAAAGAIMLWLDTLNMIHGAHVHPTYLAAQVSVGILCVLLGMAASQRQRLLYLQIRRDGLQQQRLDRLHAIGQRTQHLASHLAAPLQETQQALLAQLHDLDALQQRLQQHERPSAAHTAQHLTRAVQQLQRANHTLLRAREHALVTTHSDHAEHLLPLLKRALAELRAQPPVDTSLVSPQLSIHGDPDALRALLHPLLHLLTARCHPDAPRALRATADAHTTTLHLIGQWPDDTTQRLDADLALCADRARALFEGDLRFLDARTLQLQLSRAQPLTDPTPTPHFNPGFAALAQGRTP